MKKTFYISPEITVVDFKIEKGFGVSPQESQAMQLFNHDKSTSYEYVNTGDCMADMTGYDGENTTGGWL